MSINQLRWELLEFRSGLFDLYDKFETVTEELIFAYQLGYHRSCCMAYLKLDKDFIWHELNKTREQFYQDHGAESIKV